MTILKDYRQFGGRHWETGSVHNVLAYQGIKAPHNGQALSEALLLGISGGITFGYFLFHYEGYAPQLALLTRNTFDPLQTLLERLGVVQNLKQTASADKGLENLLEALEAGHPAIVWADAMSLPYNADAPSDQYWAMLPIVVYGHDDGAAYIADRSAQPLIVGAEDLAVARARIKKDKLRVVTLELPSLDKLPSAVSNGIWQCIRLFTEAPPKGSKRNFGLSGLAHWAQMLTNTRNKQSWTRFFPPGRPLFAALAGNSYSPGLYGWVQHYSGRGGAERGSYGEFLDEAAEILQRPGLREAAGIWRESAAAWRNLCLMALPEEIGILAKARHLLDERHNLFIHQGGASTERRREINAEIDSLRETAGHEFPLNEDQATDLYAAISEQVLKIHGLESKAIEEMQGAMA